MPTLTDAVIRSLKPPERRVKLFDGGGLYLLCTPEGGRWWRLKYRHAGRERALALGTYPDVPLRSARAARDDARRLIAAGVDPSEQRKAEKLALTDTFEAVAREWLALQTKKFAPATLEKAQWIFEDLLFPSFGSRPVREITAPELLAALRLLESRGKHETAHRMKQRAGQIFRYAIATGRADRDPSADLRGALAPIVVAHRAAITEPRGVGQLLRAIDGYTGQPSTEFALKLAPYLFVRPIELRTAEWAEFSLDGKDPLWRIPAAKMKMREEHLVPLSRQALALLRALEPHTGGGRYLFPGLRTPARPISENTLNAALRRLGYSSEEMTAHGFRAMASTLLNEKGTAPDVIELQLAHAERDAVRAAYNRAQRLPERRRLMQEWADYLDELRAAASKV